MLAYKLVNRVLQVSVEGISKPFVIRPRELHALDGDPYFECDVKSIEAVGRGFASTYKKIKIRDIKTYDCLDTREQGDLRHYRLWYESIGFDKLSEKDQELLKEVMESSFAKYEALLESGVLEFNF